MKGKLISIEGIDGSGKGTQAKLVTKTLLDLGIPAMHMSFPSYQDGFFGIEIGNLLNGEFGDVEKIHPKFSSLFFACDRLEKKEEITSILDSGTIIICDRYTESNIAHQCSKLKNEESEKLASWISHLEYVIFQIPKPNYIFYLDMPFEYSRDLVLKKDIRSYTSSKEDAYEKNYENMKNAYKIYKMLSIQQNWNIINCISNNKIRKQEDISTEITGQILENLSKIYE